MYGVQFNPEEKVAFEEVWDEWGWRSMPTLHRSIEACHRLQSSWLRIGLCHGDAGQIHRASSGEFPRPRLSDRPRDQRGVRSEQFQSQSEESDHRRTPSGGLRRRSTPEFPRSGECLNETDLHRQRTSPTIRVESSRSSITRAILLSTRSSTTFFAATTNTDGRSAGQKRA